MKIQATVIAFVSVLVIGLSHSAHAQGIGGFFKSITTGITDDSDNRRLVATIWVDPDGCEHWVMDDGLEGYMSAHLDKQGKPVCRAVPPSEDVCLTLDTSASFASGSDVVSSAGRAQLQRFFTSLVGKRILVDGHTDSVGDEKYNMELSLRRAASVAAIGQRMGVLAEPRGFGEQTPIASNATAEGRSQNRRVELSCS